MSQRPLQCLGLWVEQAKGAWLVEKGDSAEKVREVIVGSLWPVNRTLPLKRAVSGVEVKHVEAGWQVEREGAWPAGDHLGPGQRKHQVEGA